MAKRPRLEEQIQEDSYEENNSGDAGDADFNAYDAYNVGLMEMVSAMATTFARLALAHNTGPTTIQRATINKLTKDTTNRNVKFGSVFRATNEVLQDFGIQVEALPLKAKTKKDRLNRTKPVPSTAPEGTGETAYITISTLSTQVKTVLFGLDALNYTMDMDDSPMSKSIGASTDGEVMTMGILMTMLVVVIGNNNMIIEREFYRHLLAFGLENVEQPIQRPYLNLSLSLLIRLFVKQEYLAAKVENSDSASDPLVEYSVGRRAQIEFGALEVLGFFKEVFHGQSDEDHMRMFIDTLKKIYKDFTTSEVQELSVPETQVLPAPEPVAE
ncbi:hypothetical protein BABINDRAFT_166325 [Babjeviella inositovora NRRL Y-12698]|uniref:MAGE domain-containing protein n=1 Tax=Babjeviella inositovora NRRL Y-12698 TaxID=984486 RepID=A0A1E3QT95_9ASCO|nr:uncharacterized protein BABINDRAFT_166325 [Babjeviella inositovora NRRL Y-12698]ODQ80734.1 hypothetical protein BABINDRAFT_166325 [Babjeviella inositovora NRRL Y-12698]